MFDTEYTGIEARELLNELFPHRKLVLSQLTFFQRSGVTVPSGGTYRRKRRCYKLEDLLPLAVLIALKDSGIPMKNAKDVPDIIKDNSKTLFSLGKGCRVVGYGEKAELVLPDQRPSTVSIINSYLDGDVKSFLWSYDVGKLAHQLLDLAHKFQDRLFDGIDEAKKVVNG